ncbi:hypothetical protein SAMN04488056_102137 [Cohaesibacter marisflavi]|uniref:DUF1513 domain-containing protein n=1 Tax=Cohaesibacter marisflavi TaxID=655353 RepID=A0A1I5C7H4_9HYPH|nr:DUF1513 domain-containing protein [Cohaesibacter marisflavi]SFN82762.1 hypothetical protein SAMN04488056_102137 [Cohaesibacter marisflavi]
MPDRRSFITGLFALGLCPSVTWADAGSPAFLSAARKPDGSYALFGISEQGRTIFEIALPGRGHAAAAHPRRPEAVAFARRPGNFAMALDCRNGETKAVLHCPKGRHFQGHGAFSEDGSLLYTAENDYDHARGVIGIWNADQGYKRVGEFASHGVGPHDLKLMPDKKHLVIANGGIETHPDSGREKLNIPTMKPNLAYVTLDGALVEMVELPQAMHKSSIRHLSLGADGTVAFAMQWQGDINNAPAMLGLHKRGEEARLLEAPDNEQRVLQGYVGSVALDMEQKLLAASSPRGGVVHQFDTDTGEFLGAIHEEDVCGLAIRDHKLVRTSGMGIVCLSEDMAGTQMDKMRVTHRYQWDNHLIPIG